MRVKTDGPRFRHALQLLIAVIVLLPLFSVPAYAAPAWSIVPSPNPAGATLVQLSGVSCASATSCLAVGVFATGTGTSTLTERWDGTTWSIVPSPNPAGATSNQLNGVSCTSTTNCFAVGRSGTRTLTERWDGTTWSIVPSPNPVGARSSFLGGVSCISTSNCFAVGVFVATLRVGALIEHWDGTGWSIVPSPNPAGATNSQLNGVSCTGTTNCFAVGPFDITGAGALIERWDGTRWSIVPKPGGNVALGGVSCTSVTSCFAAGTTGVGALIERWDGTSWSMVPNPAGFPLQPELHAVSCLSGNQCFAVGTVFGPTTVNGGPFIEGLHGNKWSIVPSANPAGTGGAHLFGVSCVRGSKCFAVGAASGASLIERR